MQPHVAPRKLETELTIHDYLDDAKRAKECESDRELGRLLGLSGAPVSFWRNLKGYPTPEHMALVAEWGGHDPLIAVCNLGAWREKGAGTTIYKEMARKLASIAASFIAFYLISVNPTAAGTLTEQVSIKAFSTVYYVKFIKRLLRQILSAGASGFVNISNMLHSLYRRIFRDGLSSLNGPRALPC